MSENKPPLTLKEQRHLRHQGRGFEATLSDQYTVKDFNELANWLGNGCFAKDSIEGIWLDKIEMDLRDVITALIKRTMEEEKHLRSY